MDLGSAPTLGVNIDHVATLRQLRGTRYPSLLSVAKQVLEVGAAQITVHLREDRRHIQDADVVQLRKVVVSPFHLNLEMAPSPAILKIAKKIKPDWVCLVPEKRNEVTTEGGLDLKKSGPRVAQVVRAFQGTATKVSLFVEPDLETIRRAAKLGAHAVEIHTGKFCLQTRAARAREKKAIAGAAKLASALGMRVHAGHGLDYENVRELLDIPEIIEFNIGHAIVCRSVEVGMSVAVKEMIAAIAAP